MFTKHNNTASTVWKYKSNKNRRNLICSPFEYLIVLKLFNKLKVREQSSLFCGAFFVFHPIYLARETLLMFYESLFHCISLDLS